MNKQIQTKMVAEALSQHAQNSRSTSQKIISALISACTSLTKPPNNLGLEQWWDIEFKKSKFNKNLDMQNWRNL